MQINSDLKSLELLGISRKGRLQFCEDLESLGLVYIVHTYCKTHLPNQYVNMSKKIVFFCGMVIV